MSTNPPAPGPLHTSCQGTPVPRTSPGSSGQDQFGLRPECCARSTPIQSCLVRLSPPRSCPTSRGNWLLPLGTSAPAPGSVPSRAGPADHGCVHICVTAKRRGRRSPLPGAGRARCLTSCTLAHAPDTLPRIYWAPTRCPARSQTHAFTEPPACPEGPTNNTTTPTAAKADGYRGGGGGRGVNWDRTAPVYKRSSPSPVTLAREGSRAHLRGSRLSQLAV